MYRDPPADEDLITLECYQCGCHFDQEEEDFVMPDGLGICDPCLLELHTNHPEKIRGADWVWRLLELWEIERRHELLWFRPKRDLKVLKGGRYRPPAGSGSPA